MSFLVNTPISCAMRIIDQSASDLISALQRYRILEITGPLQIFASEFVHRVLTKMPWKSSKGVAGTRPSPSMVEYLMLWSPIMRLKRERQELFSCIPSRQYSWAHPGFNPEGQNEEVNEISEDYSSVVTAGLKAISTAFVSTFPLLLQHPETMGRLVEEVDTAFYNENLSESSLWEEVSRLRYLDAVFKESIRCQPTTSSIEVSVSRSDTAIAGHDLPVGTVIEWHPDSFKIDEDIYGEDVENFRPERWLVADQQERRHMEQGLLAFYISRRTCMASRVVFLELKKVVVMILLQFNVSNDAQLPATGTNVITDGAPCVRWESSRVAQSRRRIPTSYGSKPRPESSLSRRNASNGRYRNATRNSHSNGLILHKNYYYDTLAKTFVLTVAIG